MPGRPPPRRRGPSGTPVIELGRVLGFPVSLDYSWFIILFLILGTFAGLVFPGMLPGREQWVYLLMGAVGALLFFASLLGHELAHSVAARRKGIEVEGITLFVFGGMARTKSEARTPGDEFIIAGVGPLASLVFAVLFQAMALAAEGMGWEATAVLSRYLAFLNLLLALFNLLPGFPLDGGRLLRATVWRLSGSLRTGTRVATTAGRMLGYGLVGLGILSLVGGGGLVGGLWIIFIGWFLASAAATSYQQLLLTEVLRGLSAREGMTPSPETVPPDMPLEVLVHQHFLRRPFSSFPVTEDGMVVGLVTLGQVKGLPREQWEGMRVAELMYPLEETAVVTPEAPMSEVMERLFASPARRVVVARDRQVVGIVSATDVARWVDRASLAEAAGAGT